MLEPGKKSSRIFHLPSKITGTIMWNSKYPENRKVKMFVNHNNFEQGGSKVRKNVEMVHGKKSIQLQHLKHLK